MSVDNFIPKLWSAKIQDRLTYGSLLTGIVNRSFEGTLSYGNELTVAGMEDVKVKNLDSNGATITYDDIATTVDTFKIDQKKYAAIKITNIDQVQVASNGPGGDSLINKFSANMATAILEDQEEFLHAQLVAGDATPASGTVGTFAEAWDAILDINQHLTEKKTPREGRLLVVNPKFEKVLLSDQSKLTAVDTAGDSNGLRNATIGQLAGFRVVVSPYLDNTKALAVGFTPDALSFASQIERTEALVSENSFSDLLRVLHVYGGKVMQPGKVRVFKATA